MSVQFRFIIIAIVLIGAVFYLYPTYEYYQLEGDRPAKSDSVARYVWDSVHAEEWADAREGRIKLGLDLRGGVYFTMEIDAPELLRTSAESGLIDPTFDSVIAATRQEALTSDDPVIDIFKRQFESIARPQGKTLLDYYDVGDLSGSASDEEIYDKLGDNIDDAVAQAEEVIRQRVDKYGLTEPSITRQGSRRIVVELPDEEDPAGVRDLLSQAARLEFKLVKNDEKAANLFAAIDQLLAQEERGTPEQPAADEPDTTAPAGDQTVDSTGSDAGDSTADAADTTPTTIDTNKSQEEQLNDFVKSHPFTSLFGTRYGMTKDSQGGQAVSIMNTQMPAGEYAFSVPKDTIPIIKAILARPEVRSMIPEDRQITFSAYPEYTAEDGTEVFSMFVLEKEARLAGDVVTDARQDFDQASGGKPVVHMAMNAAGAERWSEITGENVGKRVAVVLDSIVYSAPWIINKIPGGQTQITGSDDIGEATRLAVVLKSGSLKAPIKIIEERIVGPSLGEDQINQGINATLFAALLVMIFMMIYYALGGVVADIAVMLNVFISLAFLAALQGTLTLPGIGALVLTIGMAVDANILIYERIREELALGKSLRNAVQLGYDKAFSAIIDSNITTFITGVILAVFGSGPIQGFAIMLMIGIGGTLFTAVFITRAVFILLLDRGAGSLSFGQPKRRVA